jgi:hypothetical protein
VVGVLLEAVQLRSCGGQPGWLLYTCGPPRWSPPRHPSQAAFNYLPPAPRLEMPHCTCQWLTPHTLLCCL